MKFLSANTTNQRRMIMFVVTAIWGVFMSLVFYKTPLTFREFIFPPIVGLAVFEFLFRTRERLRPVTLPLYIIVVLFASEILYGILYSVSYGSAWSPISTFQFLFSEFPYNLYAMIDASAVTGLACYLIKIYRRESWEIPAPESPPKVNNEPVYDESLLSFRAWLSKYALIFGLVALADIAWAYLSHWIFGADATPFRQWIFKQLGPNTYEHDKTTYNEIVAVIRGGTWFFIAINVIFLIYVLPTMAWLRKNAQLLSGFFGWYIVNGLIWYFIGNPNGSGESIFLNLYIFPANLLVLIILSANKRTRKTGLGIFYALALNFALATLLGVFFNGVCFIPFYLK